MIKIPLPGIAAQQKVIFEEATRQAIATLKANLSAPTLPPQVEIDENQYSRAHLLREDEGWEAPHPDIVGAYFRHLQMHFPEYGTDQKIAGLLGLSSDRRIREFKQGKTKVPYGVWRKFLVLTGRAPQDVLPILAYMG
ncbi:hypothetical protein [Chromobacterium amazonense]|uniref:hypothetical protein n=1 Tax=Chromobacterium amazonense TaxID=1382803 RepID=UPI001CB8E268|nr:hypothetical protein [Chromobacterium amazonense]